MMSTGEEGDVNGFPNILPIVPQQLSLPNVKLID